MIEFRPVLQQWHRNSIRVNGGNIPDLWYAIDHSNFGQGNVLTDQFRLPKCQDLLTDAPTRKHPALTDIEAVAIRHVPGI